MGYDLHITRAEEWAESQDHPITRAEVDALVHKDPELRWVSEIRATISGSEETLVIYGDFIEWNRGYPFRYWEGALTYKNPDEPAMLKLIQLAGALNARVVGDDGEEYKLHRSFFGRESIRTIGPK